MLRLETAASLEIRDLSVRYPVNSKAFARQDLALDNISLSIAAGTLVAIVGPSGCGKTTLLRTIAGLTAPTSGEVRIDGDDASKIAPKDRSIGFVFQELALYPHFTVRKNLAFPLRMARPRPARTEIDLQVNAVASALGITSLLERYPASLSGGERQRVAIGRALVRRPNLLLLDEPFSQLDNYLRILVREEIVTLHQWLRGTTVYVTHDIAEAMAIAGRIVVIHDGSIVQDADPETIYRSPNTWWIASSFCDPPMNRLAGRVKGHSIEVGKHVLPIDLSQQLPDRANVFLAFRASDVSIQAANRSSDSDSHQLTLQATYVRSYRRDDRRVHVMQSDNHYKIEVLSDQVPPLLAEPSYQLTIALDDMIFFCDQGNRLVPAESTDAGH